MRGATRPRQSGRGLRKISIHAPHARSDGVYPLKTDWKQISIHAPHARSDSTHSGMERDMHRNFNPRSSCEERRGVISLKTADRIFQSTLLMRGATEYFAPCSMYKTFQSTLLMRGATLRGGKMMQDVVSFQSTLLMRGAT